MSSTNAKPAHVKAFTNCGERRELHCADVYSLYVATDASPKRWLRVWIPPDLVVHIAASMANWLNARPCVITNEELREVGNSLEL